jgi:perosamine synthetase
MPAMTSSLYERAFAEFLGVNHAFAFWKGRVALYAILRGLGVGEGDEVILPGYTCVMNVNPIVYVGARPIYVDIEPTTYNIRPDLIEGCLTPRTKAIICQHTYGYPADVEGVLAIGRRHNIPVIEDCCLSLGSRHQGRLLGTFGRAAYFSFQWNKPYTTGLGGMAVTSDATLAEHITELCRKERQSPSHRETTLLAAQLAVYRTFIYPRTTALAQNAFRWLTRKGLVVGSSDTAEFRPRMADDFFKGIGSVQERSGRRQLRRLDRAIAHRHRMGRLYDELLAEHGWAPPPLPDGVEPALVRYPVRVADKRKALETAASRFVELGSWFECPLHPIETPLEAYDYEPGMCPVAERACREVVNLPTHPRADESTARRSVAFVASIGPAASEG